MIYHAIEGYTSEEELKQIAIWGKNVPLNGVVVEFGSLYGRSSVCWAVNCDPSVTIYCVDTFKSIDGTDISGVFLENTKHYKNIVPLKVESPDETTMFGKMIDLFFMDAAHKNPWCTQNILFYKNYMKPGGIMCGHDYHHSWPDVITTVDEMNLKWNGNLKLYERTSLWEMRV